MEPTITLGAAALTGGMVLVTLAARAWPTPRGRHRATQATWLPDTPGTRWLPCHTTSCGHLTTRHHPRPDGTYACTDCGHTTQEISR